MENKKLEIKDLVTIGVFAVIYFVGMFAVGMMGVVPILFLIYPTVLGIVMGIVTMLFMAKVKKPWALVIFGMISPLVMLLGGHTIIVIINSIIFVSIAEYIRRSGDFVSKKKNVIANGVFNMWICGSLMQMLLAKDKYMQMTRPMMGDAYANALEKLITYPNMILVYIGAFVGGIIGGLLGYKLLKKHFVKAGIL